MNDTLTPEDKTKLRQYVLMHQYDPPPFRAFMWECALQRNSPLGSLLVWWHWWMFSRIWRWKVKHGTRTR